MSDNPASDPRAHRRPVREFRTEDLAREAGIPVRTLRFYRERRLLPPPRREGRIAWYTEDHLARLRIIADLLERGHTLGGIAELLTAWEDGRDVAALLGLEGAIAAPWSEETPVPLALADLDAAYQGQVDQATLAEAEALGYVAVDGDTVSHISRRLLDASAALVAEGIPLAAVLEAAHGVRASADALADLFVELVNKQLLGGLEQRLSAGETAQLADRLARLRPIARTVVDVEFALAMDRRVHSELGSVLAHLGQRAAAEAADADPAGADPAAEREL
ncbi:MerR family transcriptional regulator [Streptacidiphilus sp. PB12-B1b]|uniref:MerR family transcriptional regulator n=1 Tax=Streptacidiphilus sp. PB12-B1b TaxID=2705012 RepID=UPI001CDC4A38|nr:MerR family transcriptional regulator [Streptacidiphilus sp. PB12-B1b]